MRTIFKVVSIFAISYAKLVIFGAQQIKTASLHFVKLQIFKVRRKSKA